MSARRLDGVLLLDKPHGLGSNAALQAVKRLYAAAKAGNAGTLDPLASGLLPVLFGEATKFSALALEADKAYEARARLGVTTSTGDAEGEVLERRACAVREDDLEPVLARFRGEIEQVPPMHSALKRDGRPLYALAREGRALMAGRQGALLTLTYLGAVRSIPSYNVMGLAKASLEANVRFLAADLGPAGIRVNAISAGPIKTLAAAGIAGFRKMLGHVAATAPLRRNVTIEDVGNAAAFLCSDLAGGITGEVLYVDGGYSTVGMSFGEDADNAKG